MESDAPALPIDDAPEAIFMSPQTGLAANTTIRRPSRPNSGGGPARSTLVTALTEESGSPLRLIEIPTDKRVADDPGNPAERVDLTVPGVREDLESLARSIANHGLASTPIVTPADVYRSAQPDLELAADPVDAGNVEWVIRVGHRRRAAMRLGRELGITGPYRPTPGSWDTMPAILRDDDASLIAIAGLRLGENFHRRNQTPIQEARDLEFLRTWPEKPLSQRELAIQTGISQAQISKRLSLLALPTEVQDAIETGDLAVVDALNHFKPLPADQQLAALALMLASARAVDEAPETEGQEKLTAATAVRRVLTAAAVPQLEAPSRTAAPTSEVLVPGESGSGEGADDAPTEGPEGATSAEPVGESASASLGAGTEAQPAALDGVRRGGDPAQDTDTAAEADSRSTMPPTDGDVGGEAEVPESEQLDEQAAAAAARVAACARAVQAGLQPRELTALLVDVALDPPRARPSAALERSTAWLGLDVSGSLEDLAEATIDRGGRPAEQLAAAVALARREADLAGTRGGRWDAASRRYVRRLAEWGVHELSDFERDKLAADAE